MPFNSIHFSANDAILIFVGMWRLCTFFLSFVDGYLGWLHILTIMNSADINVDAIEVMDGTGDHPVSEVSLRKVNITHLFSLWSLY